MPHVQDRVKADRPAEHHLALGGTQDRRQPALLARVHGVYDVALIYELLQHQDVLLRLLNQCGGLGDPASGRLMHTRVVPQVLVAVVYTCSVRKVL